MASVIPPQSAAPSTPRAAFLWLLLLALVGLLLAGYLLLLPLLAMQGSTTFGQLCAPSGRFDCFTVSASKYGSLWGLPLSAWAILLYGVVIFLALTGLAGDRAAAAPALAGIGCLSLVSVLVDAYLAWVMVAKIHYLCTFCLGTYAVNGLLFLSAMAAGRGQRITSWHRLWQLRGLLPAASWERAYQVPPAPLARLVQTLFVVGVALLTAATLGAAWLTKQLTAGNPAEIRRQLVTYLQTHPPVTVDTAGDPVLGPPSAPVTLVAFSDFLCPACQAFFTPHRLLHTNEPERVRLLFKHYPLEQVCNPYQPRTQHPGACRYAVGAECAQRQGQFWQFHDRVFEEAKRLAPQPLTAHHLDAIVPRVGLDLAAWQQCLNDPTALQAVQQDIEVAHQLGVTSTPSVFINGVMFAGAVPSSVLEEILRLLSGAPSGGR